MKSLHFTKKQLIAFANLHEFSCAEWYTLPAQYERVVLPSKNSATPNAVVKIAVTHRIVAPARIIMRLTITRAMLDEGNARCCNPNPGLYLDFMRNKNAFGLLKPCTNSCGEMWEMPLNVYNALEAYTDLCSNYPKPLPEPLDLIF